MDGKHKTFFKKLETEEIATCLENLLKENVSEVTVQNLLQKVVGGKRIMKPFCFL